MTLTTLHAKRRRCPSLPGQRLQGRAPGPAFQPQQAGEQNLERMMGEMQASLVLFDLVLFCLGLSEFW